MYSVNRTIGIQTVFRSAVAIRSGAAAPLFSCETKTGVISNGWEKHMTRAGQLFLDPITPNYDNPMLMIRDPRLIFAKESNATLSAASEPPSTEITVLGASDGLVVTRLDESSNTDDQATLEFRLSGADLPPVTGSTTTDYNRIYLVGNSALVDYRGEPTVETGGNNPGIVDPNAADTGTYDAATDLYVTGAGPIITDSNGYDVWIDRTDIVTDPVWDIDVVLAAVDLRNTIIDDVDYDILRGSSTAEITATFRIVM